MKIDSPCHHCDKHSMTCHDGCKAYADYTVELKKQNQYTREKVREIFTGDDHYKRTPRKTACQMTERTPIHG